MSNGTKQNPEVDYDAVVIGAGFGGLYMLHQFRDKLGLKTRVFDKAGGVGGTWYWNRYPGALSDTESVVYQYSFSRELWDEWSWTSRYIKQPEVLKYLEFVADRLDLRRDIQFETSLTSAVFDEQANVWRLSFDDGELIRAKYLVTALGLLSAANIPDLKGREEFQGEQYHTGDWPTGGVDLSGKRVGVIGTGSTGIQVITAIAPEVAHLTVFQRSPQYSVPVADHPVSQDVIAEQKARYDEIWAGVKNSVVAFGFKESELPAMSVSPEERQALFEKGWENGGGFRFMFELFGDIASDEEANEEACKFIRSKVAEIVDDPETARKLTPHDLYAKRPLCDSGYYATYNRDNVSLIDVKETPIEKIVAEGVQTEAGVHELDVIIYATGFDAVDGSYVKLDIRGRGGETIKDKWQSGPVSYLGVHNAGFPNMFMVLGPNGPFTNLPPSIETQVEWIAQLVAKMEGEGLATIEASAEAESEWTVTCKEIADMTLFPRAESWIFGANIPGKTNTVMFYMAGLGSYRQVMEDVVENAYQGLVFGTAQQSSPTSD